MSRQQFNNERELTDLLRRGDASAMEEVYARYANYLTAVCARYIIDDEDIRDVLQESFIKIFTKADTYHYKGEGSLKAWMTQITVNEALQYLRSRKQRGMVEYDEGVNGKNGLDVMNGFDEIDGIDGADDEAPPIEEVPTEVLLEMIRKLPPGYRTVFNLYVVEGKKHKEIAEILGIQEQTSASQLSRAKRLLAMWIKDYRTKKQDSR